MIDYGPNLHEIMNSRPVLNPLTDMPILGSSDSAANKDMMSKIMDGWVDSIT